MRGRDSILKEITAILRIKKIARTFIYSISSGIGDADLVRRDTNAQCLRHRDNE